MERFLEEEKDAPHTPAFSLLPVLLCHILLLLCLLSGLSLRDCMRRVLFVMTAFGV